jgi:hypothetical protein
MIRISAKTRAALLSALKSMSGKRIKIYAFTQVTFDWFAQDLDNETLLHVDAENRRQTLEEELEFLKQVHEQVKITFLPSVTSRHK